MSGHGVTTSFLRSYSAAPGNNFYAWCPLSLIFTSSHQIISGSSQARQMNVTWVNFAFGDHWQRQGNTRSLEVTAYLFTNNFSQKRNQTRMWSHRIQLVKTLRMVCVFACFDPIWSKVAWPKIKLSFWSLGVNAYVHISKRLDERNTNFYFRIFALAHSDRKLSAKNI